MWSFQDPFLIFSEMNLGSFTHAIVCIFFISSGGQRHRWKHQAMPEADHCLSSRIPELWRVKEHVGRTNCSLQCTHPGRHEGHPDWTREGQGLHGHAAVNSVHQAEARGHPVERGPHRTVTVCQDQVLEKSEVPYATQKASTIFFRPAAEAHVLTPPGWLVGARHGVGHLWWHCCVGWFTDGMDAWHLAVGLKLAVVSLLWQDLCLLLVWVRAPSLGRDVTLPEGLHSLMDSNGHSPYTEPLGNGTWRTVEWQVRCQEVRCVVWHLWGQRQKLGDGRRQSVGLERAGKNCNFSWP